MVLENMVVGSTSSSFVFVGDNFSFIYLYHELCEKTNTSGECLNKFEVS